MALLSWRFCSMFSSSVRPCSFRSVTGSGRRERLEKPLFPTRCLRHFSDDPVGVCIVDRATDLSALVVAAQP